LPAEILAGLLLQHFIIDLLSNVLLMHGQDVILFFHYLVLNYQKRLNYYCKHSKQSIGT